MKPVFIGLLAFVCSAFGPQAHAQGGDYLLKDEIALASIKKGLAKLYNMEFAAAERHFAEAARRRPDHPSVPFLKSIVMYWKHIPLDYEADYAEEYMALLEKAVALSEKRFERFDDEEEMEGVFFALSAHGLLAKHYSMAGQFGSALSEARKVYRYVKLGKEYKERFEEFYFAVGLYDYYREFYPKHYPVYKAAAWMFMSGDMQRGLEELRYASRNTVFVANEADIYLATIYLHYEHDNVKAAATAKRLINNYPENRYFRVQYLAMLANLERFGEMQPHIDKLNASGSDPFYRMAGKIFQGYVREHVGQDDEAALRLYQEAEAMKPQAGKRANELLVYLHAGKYRVYMRRGDKDKAQDEYRVAKEFDEYDYMKEVKEGF